jgi:DNA-binding winged helix-turn-helix (wHTH) protein
MNFQGTRRRIVEFGVFQADLDSGELFKGGLKVRLSEQPFRMLAILLECPGEVVSRDQLRRHLWPENTHVDFDRSLNTAVAKLREALGDAAGNSRYIETLPKRGYRFIAPVNGIGALHTDGEASADKTPDGYIRRLFQSKARGGVLGIAALVLAAVDISWHASFRDPVITRSVRLTNDDFTKSPELVTDGPRIYFSAWKGGQGLLAQVPPPRAAIQCCCRRLRLVRTRMSACEGYRPTNRISWWSPGNSAPYFRGMLSGI